MADRLQVVRRHLTGCSASLSPTSAAADLQSVNPNAARQYRFTREGKAFTPAQRQFYEENGFIVIKNLVPKDKLAVYRKRFLDICDGKVDPYAMTVMKEVSTLKTESIKGEAAVYRLNDYLWDDVLFDYCKLPEVLQYVTDVIGPNALAVNTVLINKPPDSGTLSSRHPMHQDLHYFPFRPAERIVCAWTAMEKITRSNGCLVVVPGTHTYELLEHDYPKWEGGVNKMCLGIMNYNPDRDDRVWVEMEEGDTVFFHPLLIHGSGANRTKGYRKCILCHYSAAECHYAADADMAAEKTGKEFVDFFKRRTKTNADVTYKDVWKNKSRLACGVEVEVDP
jgi:phytanoyl-CoA hydroxylase